MNTVWEVIEVIHGNMPEIDLDKIVLGGRIVTILCAAIILQSVIKVIGTFRRMK